MVAVVVVVGVAVVVAVGVVVGVVVGVAVVVVVADVVSELEHPRRVVFELQEAISHLDEAHRAASEQENGRTGLNGYTRDMLFGLNSAVSALMEAIESEIPENQ